MPEENITWTEDHWTIPPDIDWEVSVTHDIPPDEAWVWNCRGVLESLDRGMREGSEGMTRKRPYLSTDTASNP